MSDVQDFCDRLAKHVPAGSLGGMKKVEIEYRWYQDDSEEGPIVRCLDSQGVDVGNKLNPAQYGQLSRFMIDEVDGLRRSARGAPKPNQLLITLSSDASPTGKLTHNPQIDADYEKKQRKVLGNAAYEKFERERQDQKSPIAPAQPASVAAAPAPSVPELLGFIREELLKDVPAGWDVLDIDGEVWSENGQQNVSAIYHYTSKGNRQRFTASNTFGPMNALIQLREQFQPQGKPWRKIKMQFKRDSTATAIDTQ